MKKKSCSLVLLVVLLVALFAWGCEPDSDSKGSLEKSPLGAAVLFGEELEEIFEGYIAGEEPQQLTRNYYAVSPPTSQKSLAASHQEHSADSSKLAVVDFRLSLSSEEGERIELGARIHPDRHKGGLLELEVEERKGIDRRGGTLAEQREGNTPLNRMSVALADALLDESTCKSLPFVERGHLEEVFPGEKSQYQRVFEVLEESEEELPRICERLAGAQADEKRVRLGRAMFFVYDGGKAVARSFMDITLVEGDASLRLPERLVPLDPTANPHHAR